MKGLRVVSGITIWLALAAGLWWLVNARLTASGEVSRRLVPELWQHLTVEPPPVDLRMDERLLVAVGDPIFVVAGPRTLRQVGEIHTVIDPRSRKPAGRALAENAQALFYPSQPVRARGTRLTYYSTSSSMAWVLQTMMPPEKRQQISLALTRAIEAHHTEIVQALRPVIEQAVFDSLQVVEQDLAAAIARHRPKIERLGSRYQRELIDEKIVPLVKSEVWPIVQQHAEPAADRIGAEIWKRVSLWRFTWRYLYDAAPLPERNRVKQEWHRFVNTEIIPVLEEHSDELIGVVQQVLAEVARNEKVRAAVQENLSQITRDTELQRIVWQIVQEIIVDNPRLRTVLDKHWSGPRARAALQLTATRLEPTVRRIGDLLFGTRESGITPEFARVLRNQILGKDRRWFILECPAPGDASSPAAVQLQVCRGRTPDTNPFLPFKSRPRDVGDR